MPVVNLLRPASGLPSPVWYVADLPSAAPAPGGPGAAPWTLANYVNRVLFLLNLVADSDAAATYGADGTPPGGADPVTLSFNQIRDLVNDAASDLCREAYPVTDRGTLTVPAGWTSQATSAVAMDGGGSLWYVRACRYDAADGSSAAVLAPADPGFADLFYPFGAPPGVPAYYLLFGTAEVGCAPAARVGGTLTFSGLVIPRPLALAADATDWLEPDLSWCLAYGAARRLAEARQDDESLAPRAPLFQADYEAARAKVRNRTRRADPTLAEALWGPEVPK